jgi:anti-sigma factor RsiW
MTCDELRDALPDLLSGPGLDTASNEHLRACAACSQEADVVRALVERVRGALADTSTVAVTPPALEDVLAAANAANRPRRALGALARAAALLVAAGLGALADRALIDRTPVSPPTTAPASPVDDPGLREVLAERPGGLAASLALLDVMSRPPR